MKKLFLAMICNGLLLLAGCASTHEVGLCTYMGTCPEEEGCKDGVREDGSSCTESKMPWPSHSTGEMGGGSGGDAE